MLQNCFSVPPNRRIRRPQSTQLTVPPSGEGFEARAFAALLSHAATLGIAKLFRCKAARLDGYLETIDGETILLEMKESLSWGSTEAAGFQFLAGRHLLTNVFGSPPTKGIIVFERMAKQWNATPPNGAWGQLALEAAAVKSHIEIGALQIGPGGSVHTFSCSTP
jgi:hypothetical protein